MAAFDAFLKIEGIEGESRIEPGAIELLAYSHDVKSPRDSASGLATGKRQAAAPDGGGDVTEKVNMSDLSFSCSTGKASPQLMLACAKGKHIPKAVLTCRKSGADGTANSVPFLKIEMEDCIISSVASSGGQGDEAPVETCSLNFTKITFSWLKGGDPGDLVVKFVVKK